MCERRVGRTSAVDPAAPVMTQIRPGNCHHRRLCSASRRGDQIRGRCVASRERNMPLSIWRRNFPMQPWHTPRSNKRRGKQSRWRWRRSSPENTELGDKSLRQRGSSEMLECRNWRSRRKGQLRRNKDDDWKKSAKREDGGTGRATPKDKRPETVKSRRVNHVPDGRTDVYSKLLCSN